MAATDTLLFGTFNPHKLDEIRGIIGERFTVRGCHELSGITEAEETGATLAANARLKAEHYAHQAGLPAFADDTGLEVMALDGAPGVNSSTYAGPEGDSAANIEKLLKELENVADRRATFRTVIALAKPGEATQIFEGDLPGQIVTAPKGEGGFGYDPIFLPDGSLRTLAELKPEQKNDISHRRKALDQLINFLHNG
jgi:XTP/dITP diphosphohydrolase